MTQTGNLVYDALDLDALSGLEGNLCVLVESAGRYGPVARRVNKLTRGALDRLCQSEAFADLSEGKVMTLNYPTGLAVEAVFVAKLGAKSSPALARELGVSLGARSLRKTLTIAHSTHRYINEIALGAMLRAYSYDAQKSKPDETPSTVKVLIKEPQAYSEQANDILARVQGVFFTRDLVNAPANVLTTSQFASELMALEEIGVKVEVLEEAQLDDLGMRALLAVGQGSESPSKVVVMQWQGGGDRPPLALVGKGVVFDTGGISIKPAGGMEEMTMDMGGAGVVAGVMRTLAMRNAQANVVALVGLVENMPDGRAQRPGDVVTTMKGDTVEVINTDAEGRLVLCDVMWYAQERFQPSAMIDLATLTGAVIIALGHENAGVFANDDEFCKSFLSAANSEGEGAWRLPLGKAYADALKSQIADLKNVGGRPAGSATAAEFLHRFVKEETPWMHIDIAGVAHTKSDSAHAPKGASGWGVLALDRLIRDRYEQG